MRNEMLPIWNMFADQRNGLFVMGKADYDELPATAVDALRIINREFESQNKKEK
jgi:hypothetical protein